MKATLATVARTSHWLRERQAYQYHFRRRHDVVVTPTRDRDLRGQFGRPYLTSEISSTSSHLSTLNSRYRS